MNKKVIYSIIAILIIICIGVYTVLFIRIKGIMKDVGQSISEESVSDNSYEVIISDIHFSVSVNEIDISDNIISEDRDELVLKLNRFENLKKVIMCDCGYTNEDMEYLIDKCPNVEFVWMLHPGIWSVRTDAVAFSTLSTEDAEYRMTNDDARQLKYCKNLVLLDIGHNAVTDLSFLEYMPDLKILILMGNRDTVNGGYIKDMSELKYCTKLEYLEIFQNEVSDLSFLEYMPNLKDLNMVYNYVEDTRYLENLPNIERLFIAFNRIPEEDCIRLQELYPNAQVEYSLRSPIDKGWREHPRYFAMRNMIYNNCVDPLFQ